MTEMEIEVIDYTDSTKCPADKNITVNYNKFIRIFTASFKPKNIFPAQEYR